MEKAVSIENENLKLRETITDMGKDQEALADKRAVESMIYQGFEERMKIKYLYDSDDEESDYESDEEKGRDQGNYSGKEKKIRESYRIIANYVILLARHLVV